MRSSASAAWHETLTTTLKQYNYCFYYLPRENICKSTSSLPHICVPRPSIYAPQPSRSHSSLLFFSVFPLLYILNPFFYLFHSLLSVCTSFLSRTLKMKPTPTHTSTLWWRKTTIPAGICPHVECKILKLYD